MNLGTAYTHILDFLAGLEPLPEHVAKAKKQLERKANRLRERQEARRLSSPCACGRHNKSQGLLVCSHCWSSTPEDMQRAWNKADSREARLLAGREIIHRVHNLFRRTVCTL